MSDEVNANYHRPSPFDDVRDDGRYPPDWSARVEAVYERQNGRCWSCHESVPDPDELVVSHVDAVEDGGDHRLRNLVGQCRLCASLGADAVNWYPFKSIRADRETTVIESDDAESEPRPFSRAAFGVGLAVAALGYVYGTRGTAPVEPVVNPVVAALTGTVETVITRIDTLIAGTPVDWYDVGAVVLVAIYVVWRWVRSE